MSQTNKGRLRDEARDASFEALTQIQDCSDCVLVINRGELRMCDKHNQAMVNAVFAITCWRHATD